VAAFVDGTNVRGGIVVGDWIAWVAVGVAVWIAVAALVAVLLGRTVRHRDRQVPRDDADVEVPPRTPATGPPVPERRRRT
jgi:hypothetical protein